MLLLSLEKHFLDVDRFCNEQLHTLFLSIDSRTYFLKSKDLTRYLISREVPEFEFVTEVKGIEKIEMKKVDRLQHISLPSTLYGYIPNTLAEDNDPVDVFLIFPSIYDTYKIDTNTIFNFIPLLKINSIDNGEKDDKVIGIPSCFLMYFASNTSITHYVMNIIVFLQTQNFINKKLELTSIDDFNKTNIFIKNSFLK